MDIPHSSEASPITGARTVSAKQRIRARVYRGAHRILAERVPVRVRSLRREEPQPHLGELLQSGESQFQLALGEAFGGACRLCGTT